MNSNDLAEWFRQQMYAANWPSGCRIAPYEGSILQFLQRGGGQDFGKQRGPGFTRPKAGTRGKHGKQRGGKK